MASVPNGGSAVDTGARTPVDPGTARSWVSVHRELHELFVQFGFLLIEVVEAHASGFVLLVEIFDGDEHFARAVETTLSDGRVDQVDLALRTTPFTLGCSLGLLGSFTLQFVEGRALRTDGVLLPVRRGGCGCRRQSQESRRPLGRRLPRSSRNNQMGRTFWASSPLRPGATSNSTA